MSAPVAKVDDVAGYSEDGLYRWWFERRWGDGDLLCWVGLNPGTGDTDGKARPSLRRVSDRATQWGFDGVLVVNLFAYRSTDPRALARAAGDHDIVGTGNDEHIQRASRRCVLTLAAWGARGRLQHRGESVTAMLQRPVCLGLTKHGEPRHPLYVPASAEHTLYRRST